MDCRSLYINFILRSPFFRFDECEKNIQRASRQSLEDQAKIIEELFSQQPNATSLLNSTIETGEKLYPSTSLEGKEIINKQLQELRDAMDTLFDEIAKSDRNLKSKHVKWLGFEESLAKVSNWLRETEKQLPQNIELKSTLEEKKAQLQVYRNYLHEVSTHQQDIVDLRDKTDSLPERNEHIDNQFTSVSDQYDKLQKRAQNFVEQYEIIVSNHQQYAKAVQDGQDWIDSTNSNIAHLSDLDLDRTSLQSNLERLKGLKASIRDEESRILAIKSLGDKVIPGTIDYGQVNIRSQIETSQQEWAALVSALDSAIQQLETKLQLWTEYESLKDKCLLWIRDTDNKLHSVDLKPTAQDKKTQLDDLKKLQGEIRAKELEIDQVTERAQQLNKGLMGRPSQISELGVKYQQICQKIKDLTTRWQQHVANHQDFDSQVEQFSEWMDDIKEKLSYCSDITGIPQKELETKLETVQELVLRKEDGSSKLQALVELAQNVLANTAQQGHTEINETLARLQEDWSNLASSLVETKSILDDALTKWAELLEEIKSLVKTIELLESQYEDLSEFQATLTEKKTVLARIKTLEEKTRAEKIDVDNFKAQIVEVLQKKKGGEATTEALKTLNKFDAITEKIFVSCYITY